MTRGAWCALAGLLLVSAPTFAAVRQPVGLAPVVQQQRRDPTEFTMLKDEGFPLNVSPESVSADEAELGDGDMVMGIVINGEARAYPVNYMNGPTNEVVNDVLGGQAIAPSW